MRIKTYGFDRVEMARNLSLDQLEELTRIVTAKHKVDPDSASTTLFLVDKAGLKKLDNISWAVYHKTKKRNI